MLYKARLRIPFRIRAFILSLEIVGRVGQWCGVEGSREGVDCVC